MYMLSLLRIIATSQFIGNDPIDYQRNSKEGKYPRSLVLSTGSLTAVVVPCNLIPSPGLLRLVVFGPLAPFVISAPVSAWSLPGCPTFCLPGVPGLGLVFFCAVTLFSEPATI